MNNYNDGVVHFYSKKHITNSFKATKNVTNREDLNFISEYYYKEETQRQQDIVFAGAMDRKLSLKISIPYINTLQTDYVAIIDNYLYSIFHIDPDKTKNKTYIYLEGMRDVER
ncbi:MAG: hypothetical protein IJV31_00095 [Clostridia bacterium]|nr:hypothetical protein [Clostridia bacterium]